MTLSPDSWPNGIVAEVLGHPDSGVSVVLDPDDLLTLPDDVGELVSVSDQSSLRSAYELRGRRRLPEDGRVVIQVSDPAVRTPRDLPWDIEQRSRVTVVRFPGERKWLDLYRALENDEQSRLASLLEQRKNPQPRDVLETTFGVVLPAPTEAAEFDAVARLSLSVIPAAAWAVVRPLVRGQLASALAADPPALEVVQTAWDDWLMRGSASPHAGLFARVGPALVSLITFGLLRPAKRAAEGLPTWTIVGSAGADPGERIATLLEQQPPLAASSLDDWARVAAWWGSLRAAIADLPPARRDEFKGALDAWGPINESFVPWLTANLGLLQTSSRLVPTTVERIAPFLARRMRSGVKRVCLIVMDGMGFAQWSLIRDQLGLHVEETHGVAAIAPTLTPYSRQAIFAGALPSSFPKSLGDNTKERLLWTSFWEGQGVTPSAIRYASTPGASAPDVPSLDDADVVGVAVLAVDELLHGAKLLGDAQVADAVRFWLGHGFLASLIASASERGFEVWLTADHGNIEATAIDYLPMEGVAVNRTGERVRLYATETLRDAARADGLAWQPPGLPTDGPFPVFAPGRSAYVRGTHPVVVHGGLSLDEVIVPLVRVSP